MSEKMLKFVNVGMQMPTKRDHGEIGRASCRERV